LVSAASTSDGYWRIFAADFYFNQDCCDIVYRKAGFAVIEARRKYGGDGVFRRPVNEFPMLNFIGTMEHDSWYAIDDEKNETKIGYATLTPLVVTEAVRRSVTSRDGKIVLPDPESNAEDLETQVKATMAHD
jgi:hypothetical protein